MRYLSNVRSCQAEISISIRKCSTLRNRRQSASCFQQVFRSYEKCNSWSGRQLEQVLRKCDRGGDKPPCRMCDR